MWSKIKAESVTVSISQVQLKPANVVCRVCSKNVCRKCKVYFGQEDTIFFAPALRPVLCSLNSKERVTKQTPDHENVSRDAQ